MSITNIQKTEKVKVFLRLLDCNEKFKDACSKSGLKLDDIKSLLLSN
ncbi:MAG: hypothetical protein U9Q33_01670 [Campylobacterota bacterium]|nr:hypothetical protein [Campylobacterota bacterium]